MIHHTFMLDGFLGRPKRFARLQRTIESHNGTAEIFRYNSTGLGALDAEGEKLAAAISPWLWVPGVAAFIYVMFYIGGKQIDWIVILMALWILQSALPRVRNALLRGARNNPYYQLTVPQRAMVTASYVLLAALLALMFWGPHKLGLNF
jgi:hypothetical protein